MAQDDPSGLAIAQAYQILKQAADGRQWMVYPNQGPVGPAIAATPQQPLPQINMLRALSRPVGTPQKGLYDMLPNDDPSGWGTARDLGTMALMTALAPALPAALAVPAVYQLSQSGALGNLGEAIANRLGVQNPVLRSNVVSVPDMLAQFATGAGKGPADGIEAAAAGVGPRSPWFQAQRPQPERPLWSPGQRLDITFPPEGPRPEQEFIQRMMEDRVAKTIGVIPANAPPEVKLRRLVELATPELLEQLKKPAAESGIEWYSGDQKLARQLNQRVFPELGDDTIHAFHTAVSAPMSSGQNPKSEVTMANRIWDIFRNNDFRELPETQPDGSMWGRNSGQIVKLNNMLRDMGNIDNVADWLRSWQRVDDIRQYRPGAEGKASDVVPGGLVFGPKIGRYFWDLLGIPHEGSTVDLWDTRGNQRRLGQLFDAQGNPIEAPTEVDRGTFMELHRILGDQTGLERKQAQSALWHYEQDLYRRLGLQAPSYRRSDGARAYLQSMGLEP